MSGLYGRSVVRTYYAIVVHKLDNVGCRKVPRVLTINTIWFLEKFNSLNNTICSNLKSTFLFGNACTFWGFPVTEIWKKICNWSVTSFHFIFKLRQNWWKKFAVIGLTTKKAVVEGNNWLLQTSAQICDSFRKLLWDRREKHTSDPVRDHACYIINYGRHRKIRLIQQVPSQLIWCLKIFIIQQSWTMRFDLTQSVLMRVHQMLLDQLPWWRLSFQFGRRELHLCTDQGEGTITREMYV